MMNNLMMCLVTMFVDYGQTMDIRNHQQLQETNPVLGDHPSDSDIRRHFTMFAGIYTASYIVLPDDLSKSAMIICASSHGNAAVNNGSMGVGWRF